MIGETGLKLIAIAVIGGLFACAGLGLFLIHSSTQTTQTASGSVDYFSWSCQQLQTSVNDELNKDAGLSLANYGVADSNLQLAQIYVGIMQLKGCVIQ